MNILFLLKIKNDVRYAHDDNTIRQGLEKMLRYGYTAIPVISREGDYVGTVTEGDFLRHILEHGRGSLKAQEEYPIREIIRTDFMPAVKISATPAEVLDRAVNQNFVPVVDDRNMYIGIVKRKDILNMMMGERNNK